VSVPPLDERLRARFVVLADGLIPGTDAMPAPGSVDVGGAGLDAVLASRPDVTTALIRALEAADDVEDAIAWAAELADVDAIAHAALVTAVVGAYYLRPEVRARLGYPGQTGVEVVADPYPEYVHDGTLERVLERGPIYRPTPPAGRRRGSAE